MNIKLIILSILSVIFSLSTLSGQNMILSSGINFNYHDKQYTKAEIVTFLENQPVSALEIRRYKKNRALSKGFLYTGLTIIGSVVVYSTLANERKGGDSPDWRYFAPIFYGSLITIVVIPIGLICRLSSNFSFNKARKKFNNARSEIIGYSQQPSLNLALGNNGIGLLLRF